MTEVSAHVRRAYVDTRFGQTHFYEAKPDRYVGPTLLCFHMSPWAATVFEPLLAEMGKTRRVIAVDTPGYGNSDPPPKEPSMADYAGTMLDLIDALGLHQIDLLGERTGAKVALAVAALAPNRTRRLILISPVIWTESEQAGRENYAPEKIERDGSHLKSYWTISTALSMPGRSLAMIGRVFHARLAQNATAHWGRRAAAGFDAEGALAALHKPVMVVRPGDELFAISGRAEPLLRHPASRTVEKPDWGLGFMDVVPEAAGGLFSEFLGEKSSE